MQNRTSFEERAKNAQSLEFLMNHYLSQDNSEETSINKFSTLIYKSSYKLSNYISKHSFPSSSIQLQKSDSQPEATNEMDIRKRIQKVLNNAILEKNSHLASESLSFNIKKQNSIIKTNNNINNKDKALSLSKSIVQPILNQTDNDFITSSDKNSVLTTPNKIHTYQLKPINDIKLKLINPGQTFKNEKIIGSNLIQKQLTNYGENKYRCLKRENYVIYDSVSESEEEEIQKHIIMPQSFYLTIWNTCILITILYYILFIPYYLAFIKGASLSIKIIEVIAEIMYLMDIVIQFFIPVFKDTSQDQYNFNLRDIALNYLLSWLVFDIIVSFPYCSIINFIVYDQDYNSYLNKGIELIKIIKILKVLKVFFHSNDQLSHELTIIDYFLPVKLRRLFNFFFYFFIMNHTLACLWIFIATLEYPNWIIHQNMQDCSSIDIYVSSFYFSLASIYTIGYGDIRPINSYERYYNIALQSIGLFLYSYFISSMTFALKKTKKELMFDDKMNLLETLKIQYKLESKLYTKIKKHIQHSRKFNQNERVFFLQALPNSLKYALISFIYADVLSFKIFNNTNLDFKARIVLNLKPAWYSKSEFVVQKGTFIEEIVFIKKGVLGLEFQYKNHLIHINKLHSGEHFGEIDMLLDNASEFDLIVKSKHAEVLLLSKENVIDIGHEFSTLFYKIKKKSLENYTLFKQIARQKIRQIHLSILDNKRASISRKNCYSEGFEFDTKKDIESLNDYGNNSKNNHKVIPNYINDVIEEELIENEEDKEESNTGSNNNNNDLTVQQIENEIISLRSNSSAIKYRRKKYYTKTSINRNNNHFFIRDFENKQQPTRRKSQCQLQVSKIVNSTIIRQISNSSPESFKYHDTNDRSIQSMKQVNLHNRSSIGNELLPKRKASCALKDIETVNNLKEMKMQSTLIIKKMKEGSMAINNPSTFYGQVFDKWQIDNQLQRMDCVYKNITIFNKLQPRKTNK